MSIINSFPGYKYEYDEEKKSYANLYKGVDVGKGGLVYSKFGMYGNVALLDVQSMHPNSLINMNYFGKYTDRYRDIKDARVYIKHDDYEPVRNMFDGKLAKYLDDKEQASMLSAALKIAVNSTYGLTAANFPNAMRHKDNKNNIVALRGALFMMDLKEAVLKEGFEIIHCKTDSVKIPDANKDIIDFVMDFGKRYGYLFEHEATYDRLCLINNAVYVARSGSSNEPIFKKGEYVGPWTSTGAELIHPVVFKRLFSRQEIVFKDYCEMKSVKDSKMYLDFNEHLGEDQHDRKFVGATGLFVPVRDGCGGGLLVRESKKGDGEYKYDAVTGTKGYRWKEAWLVKENGEEDQIEFGYSDNLVDKAKKAIAYYGDFDWFVSDSPYSKESHLIYPF